MPYLVRPLGTLDPWSLKQKSVRKRLFWHLGVKRMLRSRRHSLHQRRRETLSGDRAGSFQA